MKVNWTRFGKVVDPPHWVLTSHIRPDRDALGSELGMAGVLEAPGKRVAIVNGRPDAAQPGVSRPGRRIRYARRQ